MIRFIKRNLTTVLRLPVAAVADAVTLGNFGRGSFIGETLDEHQQQKRIDDLVDLIEAVRKAKGEP